ncbi:MULTISPECIES: GGDEF and EAL domain-containing protein [Modicisalibacter]|uniref:putative bifunctional diguanylate cyclase/phosphodiesterase n=1 Tax=Modicisalibacter TaxID=574347 RepID=UPI00100A28F0|nr:MULTISPECIES: GGDEF and EAL domain-containing protein [Halomonadaceae]MBZ9557470.1 EAL domain-containing protein [Modicisalibacter sp. R2A 31.J]MBZ9573864.1 EAL domain-containing protein [Modicisalibacter sp. MOD 31.J]
MVPLPPLIESVVRVLELPGIAITVLDGEREGFPLLFANIGFEQLTGRTQDALIGQDCRLLQPGPSHQDIREPIRRVLDENRALKETIEYALQDGTHLRIEMTLSPVANHDGHRYLICIQQNVTDHRRLGLAMAVFDSTHDGITVTDADKIIIDINPAFTRLTGYERAEVLGHTPQMLSSGKHDATFYQSMFTAVNQHGFWSGDIWNTRKDGSQLIVNTTISAVRDDTGEVVNYVSVFRDITQQRLNQARLERMAIYDPLTGLYNREHFIAMLETHLTSLQFTESGIAVLFMDLDDFKPINDGYGHAAGDELLVEVSRRLKRLMRSTDIVARFGGDEFVIALTGMGNGDKASKVAQKIIDDLIQPFQLANGELVGISVSIGLAFTNDYRLSTNTLIDSADQAMYEAKLGGKNRIARAHRYIEARSQDAFQRIKEAFEDGELELYFQPIVDLASGHTHSFEALTRWRHPQEGVLGPQHFIDVIMHSSLSLPFGQWLVREAGYMAKQLQSHGFTTTVSINLSQDQIETGSFLRAITETRDALGLATPYLTIEVLESSQFHDLDLACSQLLEAKQLGTSIALDDFGSGISSITYASQLPIDTLKIDRSAINNIDTRANQRQFVGGIIDMAHAMHRKVLAEGVEREAQLEALRAFQCDLAQGFLFGEPMPAEEVIAHYLASDAVPANPLRPMRELA